MTGSAGSTAAGGSAKGGSALSLVLLHPLPLDGSVWGPVRHQLDLDLDPTIDLEVVAPTLYGLGPSIEDWAGAVLDRTSPGPLVVVGCSVGGSCAIEVARLAPDRVRALVLAGAKAGHRPEPEVRAAALRHLADHGMAAAWPRWWAPLFAPEAEPEVVALGRQIAFAQDVDDVIGGVTAFHSRADRTDVVDALTIPIHIVRGEHDRIPARPAALAAGLHHGTFHRVAGAGHYLPLERPVELASILAEVIAVAARPAAPELIAPP